MISQETFIKYYTILSEEFGEGLSDARMMMHYEILSKEMNDQEFINSVKSILQSRKYNKMPKLAEILEYARPDTESIATIAWSDVERAISKAGSYQSVTFEDKVVNSVIDALGGWVWLCSQDIAEIKWIKKDFNKLYGIHLKREEHPTHLIGIAERSNGVVEVIPMVKAGYEIPKGTIVPALNPSQTDKINNQVSELIGSIKDGK
jgi:metal-dependent amidase/aminoacylase/carboxypeptidase family protein